MTAAASMTAKYLREVAMHSFNRFWRAKSPELKPTCGYAVDAGRFLNDIAPLRRELNVPDEILIRCK
ncbi:MAG: hypothetical protein QM811_13880 [Pirellulales bacterium]